MSYSSGFYSTGSSLGGGMGGGYGGGYGGSVNNTSLQGLSTIKPIRPSFKTSEGHYKLIKEISPQAQKYSKRLLTRSFVKLSMFSNSVSSHQSATTPAGGSGSGSGKAKQKNIIHPPSYNSNNEIYFALITGVTYFLYHFVNVDKTEHEERVVSSIDRNLTCVRFNRVKSTNHKMHLIIGTDCGELHYIEQGEPPSIVFNRGGRLVAHCVTAVEWVPGSCTQFIACFANGTILVFDITRPEMTPGVAMTNEYASQRSKMNPVGELFVSKKSINGVAFSPNGRYLAVAALDGLLSVFDFDAKQLVVAFKSYFGGFLCVDWSPDGKYLASGGEDDFLSIWSFEERCLVARGQGHQSWVSSVRFDPDVILDEEGLKTQTNSPLLQPINKQPAASLFYRIVTGGEDTRLLLWDFTRDSLRKPRNLQTSKPVDGLDQSTTNAVPAPSMDASNPLIVNAPSRLHAPILLPVVSHRVHPDPVTDIMLTKEWIVTATNKKICIWARPNTVANTQKADSMMCSPNTPSSFTAMNMKFHE
ncbi:hypothetical protein SAMD00019534_046240 [Acytostelium subglobosum LB1]|uniref:hypothetical protein n=1 Tax=Acytostelium subglobosum LB1 TaxID=1410327 RepID=UPI000644AF7F|nr:hypothetical protein SAMD00019534_046240 [Acytostelium subglobosum LB1]GAM21449.1 hypothetical protein SAMD00019534_046240 [Acytostelium subglobosum LB1]|eukprot:XP_012755568.1 hypothetical protein SAMD00019534_046240 [Acytostelium subglobosum LB1]